MQVVPTRRSVGTTHCARHDRCRGNGVSPRAGTVQEETHAVGLPLTGAISVQRRQAVASMLEGRKHHVVEARLVAFFLLC